MTAHTEDESVKVVAETTWRCMFPDALLAGKTFDNEDPRLRQCYLDTAMDSLTAYHQFLSDRGYVIVPREPTDEMCKAGADAVTDGETDARICWEAMISAVGAP